MTFDQIKQNLIQGAAKYQTLIGGTGQSLSDRVRNFGQQAQTTGYNMAAGLANNVAPNVGATVSKFQTTPGSLADKLMASGKQLINPRPLDTIQTFTVGGTNADTGKVLQERVSLAQRLKSEGKDPALAQQGLMPTQVKSIKNAVIALGTGGDMKNTMGMSTKAVPEEQNYNKFDNRFGDLANKYKTESSFIKAAQKRAEKEWGETGTYVAAPNKSLSEYYKANKMGGFSMFNKRTEEQLKVIGKRDAIQARRDVMNNTGEELVDTTIQTKDLVSTQYTDPLSIKNYEKQILAGDKSPLVVNYNNGKYEVWDGNHRLQAYKNLGIDDVPVVVNKSGANPISPLLSEAKKYKSADEFVKAQGMPFYHGARENWTGSFKQPTKGAYQNEAIFVAPSESSASYYNRGGGIKQAFISKNSKIFNFRNPNDIKAIEGLKSDKQFIDYLNKNWNYTPDEVLSLIKDGRYDWIQRPEVTEFLRRKGYDGFINIDHGGGETIGVFSNKNIKTKQELVDIWNKSHK